ncbi:uncharacterized protein Z520_01180 [Fonsecaea multimorphosa CBS 102226]|uniref:non-specific serine/threonine protein kinase n=1 Tax=Fonsecaea multimorphosa CBS 102226 TaxID=1442371 RepID=A0A0D2KGW2_9EURO|nr:uncharacterized protein Z520_01180 [Fonsecaea multimorphosa CBS 102226]KIY02715.1 hypothetical protein Z520_01180 [Fonsecaea multimorphosa CBS 102226]
MALDQFRVDWGANVLQSFFEDSDQRDVVAESPIKHFFSWAETSSTGRMRPTGERFRHIFSSTLGLHDEDEWRFERPLGKGSFGAAALFIKSNARQEKTDAFVLKVTDVEPRAFLPATGKKIYLTAEAAIMAQTNDLDSDNLVRLRQYKVDQQYCRYYIEFCEFDTLETLRLRYKAWNQYLPETFLWHTFYFLAQAYLDFCTGPFRSLRFDNFRQAMPGQYLLHMDIKTDNIFLGMNTTKDDGTVWYPVPKIGDFGLATTTNPDELTTNTAQILQRGTAAWMPPEQRIHHMQDWRRYYFDGDVNPRFPSNRQTKLHRIRPEANLWAIGAVMWNLMTMGEIEELSEKVDDILLGEGPAWQAFDGTNILDSVAPEVRDRYSPELFELIQQCTALRPADRPPPKRLLQDVFSNLNQCFAREEEAFRRTQDPRPLTVAFEKDHINDLPDGGANFDRPKIFWDDFADHLLWAPREWDLVCPPTAPRTLEFDDRWPLPLRERINERWKEAVLKRDRRLAAANVRNTRGAAATGTLSPAQQQTAVPSGGIFRAPSTDHYDPDGQPRKKFKR